MGSNNNPLALFESIIKDYSAFKKRGDEFREKGSLDGALVNYTLASNNLHHASNISNDASFQKYIKEASLKDWCEGVCGKIDGLQNEVLSMIIPLQEELKRRRMYERGGQGDEDEQKKCDYDKYKQLTFEKAEDCIVFDNIIGQEKAKETLKNNFVWPNVFPNLYPKVAKGVLLYGPPGTGKTFLAKAAANELNSGSYDPNFSVLFFAPQGGDLKGKYVGETEKNIRDCFKCASEAATQCQNEKNEKEQDPLRKGKHRVMSILFIDEVDAIAGDRTKDETGMMSLSVNALLQAIDGVNSYKNVAVMAATNFPWDLDSAFLRRFDNKILIDLPSHNDMFKLIKMQLDEFIGRISAYAKLPETEPAEKPRHTKPKAQIKCSSSCPEVEDQKFLFTKEYNTYITKLDETSLKALSVKLAEKKFSPSDVSMLVKNVLRNVADRARQNNNFYKTQVNLLLPQEKSDKVIYISTLCIPEKDIINLKPCDEASTEACKKILELPKIEFATLDNTKYINKSLYPKETYLSDPMVKEFFIKEGSETNNITVLFPVDIQLKYSDDTEQLKKFYIISKIDTTYLKQGWLRWLGNKATLGFFGRKQEMTADEKKQLSAYQTLVYNMETLLMVESLEQKNGQELIKCKSKLIKTSPESSIGLIKQSLAEGVFQDKDNNVNKDLTNFLLLQDPNIYGGQGDVKFGLFDGGEKTIILTENTIKKDPTIKKDAFFTLDIRNSDFVELLPLTQSSIKEAEYKELKEYEKDPTKYVKKTK
jgi:SpoVK/Ycf46/Vps4 family AAA+-type ATPase